MSALEPTSASRHPLHPHHMYARLRRCGNCPHHSHLRWFRLSTYLARLKSSSSETLSASDLLRDEAAQGHPVHAVVHDVFLPGARHVAHEHTWADWVCAPVEPAVLWWRVAQPVCRCSSLRACRGSSRSGLAHTRSPSRWCFDSYRGWSRPTMSSSTLSTSWSLEVSSGSSNECGVLAHASSTSDI
jgi:hypothetical protein